MNRQVLSNGVYTLSDLEANAAATLPLATAEFYAGGAMDMITWVLTIGVMANI
jgi:hypothetical protein